MELTQNKKVILSSIDELRKKRNKRPDKESVSLHVSTKHGLSMEEALETIDSLIEEQVIQIKKTDKGKDSFYVSSSFINVSNTEGKEQVFEKLDCDQKDIGDQQNDSFLCFLDDVKTPTKELSCHLPAYLANFRENDKQYMKYHEIENINKQDTEHNDIPKFKKHMWNAVTNLNEEIQGLKDSFSERRDPPQDQHSAHILYERLICCLEERVRNLEKELDSKQRIIETILNQQDATCHTQEVEPVSHLRAIQRKSKEVQVPSTHEEKDNQADSKKAKINKKPSTVEGTKTKERNNRSKRLQQNSKAQEISSHAPPHLPSGNENKEPEGEQSERKSENIQNQVTVIGDSMLHGINDRGLMNCQRKVYVKVNPGANTQDIVDHMKPAIRRKPDTLIIHTGTNDITSGTDTQEFLDHAVNLIKTESPETEIVISLPILRIDRGGQYTKKLRELKARMKKYCSQKRIKTIDNDNITEESLGMKGLHLNKRGVAKLANNLLNFLNNN